MSSNGLVDVATSFNFLASILRETPSTSLPSWLRPVPEAVCSPQSSPAANRSPAAARAEQREAEPSCGETAPGRAARGKAPAAAPRGAHMEAVSGGRG